MSYSRVGKFVDLECNKCKCKYSIPLNTFYTRNKNNTPNFCRKCMKEYKSQIEKERYENKTPEEKEAHAQRTRDQLARRTPEEQAIINKKNSEGLVKHWKTVSSEDKKKRTEPMQTMIKEKRKQMTPEEKSAIARKQYENMTPEERENDRLNKSEKMKAYNASLSMEEKQARAAHMNDVNKLKSDEEKADIYKRSHQWYYDLDDEEKVDYANSKKEWHDNLSPEEKEAYSQKAKDRANNLPLEEKMRISKLHQDNWNKLTSEEQAKRSKKALSSSGKINKFAIKFEKAFNESHLSNDFYLLSEYPMIGETIHIWDYGIYNKFTNELVMVVDLDGAYFHADICDYDGIHSRE